MRNYGSLSVSNLLIEAVKEINDVPSGQVFKVKDLFKGYDWNNFPISVRLTLGSIFLEEAKTGLKDVVEILNKNSSNQQLYKKK